MLLKRATLEGIRDGRITRDAGFDGVAALKRELEGREGDLYRVRVAWSGEDPRIALRSKAELDAAEREELDRRLDGMDARSQDGSWTREFLRRIEAGPGERAPDLAVEFEMETRPFKARVRRLKELGLTESLAVGYRLSPRGRAYLRGARR